MNMSKLVKCIQNSFEIPNFFGNVCVGFKFQSKRKKKNFCGINDVRYRQVHILFLHSIGLTKEWYLKYKVAKNQNIIAS